jgi:curved DNA-binding protein CbpA
MTHYQALELPDNASAADIRRAYRRLVLLTHPDRTPDPAAHARYLAINAAYDILSDPARRQAYDWTLRSPAPSPPPPVPPGKARDAQRRRTAPPRRTAASDKAQQILQQEWILHKARPFLNGVMLFGISLALDLCLATEHAELVVLTETLSYRKAYIDTDRGSILLPAELPPGSTLLVKRTPIWRTAISVRSAARFQPFIPISIYRGASNSFWLALLLAASLARYPRLSTDQRLVAAVVALVCLVLTLLQMLQAGNGY